MGSFHALCFVWFCSGLASALRVCAALISPCTLSTVNCLLCAFDVIAQLPREGKSISPTYKVHTCTQGVNKDIFGPEGDWGRGLGLDCCIPSFWMRNVELWSWGWGLGGGCCSPAMVQGDHGRVGPCTLGSCPSALRVPSLSEALREEYHIRSQEPGGLCLCHFVILSQSDDPSFPGLSGTVTPAPPMVPWA
jgi:hypothetical protein